MVLVGEGLQPWNAGEAWGAGCSVGAVNAAGAILTRDRGRRTKEGIVRWEFSHWGCRQAFTLEAVCLVAASTDVISFESSEGLGVGENEALRP